MITIRIAIHINSTCIRYFYPWQKLKHAHAKCSEMTADSSTVFISNCYFMRLVEKMCPKHMEDREIEEISVVTSFLYSVFVMWCVGVLVSSDWRKGDS